MILAIIANRKQQTRRAIQPQPDRNLTSLAHVRGGPVKVIAMREGRYSIFCQFGQPGDELWVQETHTITEWKSPQSRSFSENLILVRGYYDADQTPFSIILDERESMLFLQRKKRLATVPGRFMYHSLSRLTLEITDVRVERLQSISEQDAKAEGCEAEVEMPFDYWEGYSTRLIDRYGNSAHQMIPKANWPDPPPWLTEVRTHKGMQGSNISALTKFRSLWNSIHGKSHPWEANEWLWCISFKRKEAQ